MPTKQQGVVKEIEAQMMQLDIKIQKLNDSPNGLVSKYVEFLMQKRQLQELYNQEKQKADYES